MATEVNAGAIAGGVVGGLAVIALAGVLLFYLKGKRRAGDTTGHAPGQHGSSGTNYAAPGAGQVMGSFLLW